MNKTISINNKNNKKGIMAMLSGSFGYALYPILVSIAAFAGFLPKNASISEKFLWGFVLVGGKELFNLFYQWIYISLKGIGDSKKFISIFLSIPQIYKNILNKGMKNKYGWIVALAAILAGPIGYSIETTGIVLSGPSLGTLLVNLIPIFIVIFTNTFFKKKTSTFSIAMIAIIVFSVIGNSLGQYFTLSSESSENISIALLTGAATAILWALENVMMKYASDKTDLNNVEIVTIKLTTSAFIIPAFFIPIISYSSGLGHIGYNWYSNLFTNNEWFHWLIGIGLIMFFARHLYFVSITTITPIISSLTLIIRFAFIPILQLIIFTALSKAINVNWYIFVPLSFIAWTAVLFLLIDQNKS